MKNTLSQPFPALLIAGMYGELQDLSAAIATRPEGQRYPTPKEADIRRKTILSIRDLKKEDSTPSLKLLKAFIAHVAGPDKDLSKFLSQHINNFLQTEAPDAYPPQEDAVNEIAEEQQNLHPEPAAQVHSTDKPIPISTHLYTQSDNVIDDVKIPEPACDEEYLDAVCLQDAGYELTPAEAHTIEYYQHRQQCYWRQLKRLNGAAATDICNKNLEMIEKRIRDYKESGKWKRLVSHSQVA